MDKTERNDEMQDELGHEELDAVAGGAGVQVVFDGYGGKASQGSQGSVSGIGPCGGNEGAVAGFGPCDGNSVAVSGFGPCDGTSSAAGFGPCA